jgi:predicted enzyme related to lactoylglutathione lyase
MADPNAGRFTWHELMTADTATTAKFYTSLLGWKIQEMDMGPMGTYRLFLNGDKQVGGAMTSPPGVPSHWLPYVSTDSTDATSKRITEFGGKLVVPPTDVPNMVRFAVGLDPQGAGFGIVQNISDRTPEPISDAPPAPGSFCWDELMSKDLPAAAKYYGSVFGWTGKTGEGAMPYWHWKHGDKDIGGMIALPMPNVPPHWLAYIAVADVDAKTAKVKELGGKILMPSMDIEKVGKFSVVQDTSGASFALFRSARV